MAFNDYLTDTCEIRQLLALKDSMGGITKSWTTVSTEQCLVRPRTGGVDRDDAKDGSQATHSILLSGSHNLSARNQIKIGTYIYNVIKCNDWNSLGHHTSVDCILETS